MTDAPPPVPPVPETVPPTAPDRHEIGQSLATENLIETYQVVAEWIRFADAKAAVVLTVGGAVAGLMIPTLKEYLASDHAGQPAEWWSRVVVGLFLGWLVTLGLSFVSAFRCVLPYRRGGAHPALDRCAHFHPAAIARKYRIDAFDEFLAGYQRAGAEGFHREVLAGLLIDSHISNAKYQRVLTAIRLLAVSSVLGLMYFISIQF